MIPVTLRMNVRFLGAALLLALQSTAVSAQQLEVIREVPRTTWTGCPRIDTEDDTPAGQREEAGRLAAEATQAAILGDQAVALELLGRAAELDPMSPSIAYRLGRSLEEQGRGDEAVRAYCRFLALAPDAPDAADAEQRITVITDAGGFSVPAAAAESFRAGLAAFDGRDLVGAESAFAAAAEAAPAWGATYYNRALMRLGLNRRADAAEDLRRFLEHSPGSPQFDEVLDVLGTLRGGAAPYNPGAALFTGLIFPGMGQFTTGRPAIGALFLGAAAGSIAAGLLIEKTEVACLSPPVDGVCPPDQVARSDAEHPYLLPAVAVAAGFTLFGAIDAYRGAKKRNAEAGVRVGGALVVPPAFHVALDGVRLELLRVHF